MTTPQEEAPKISEKLGIPKLFLKREDLHPYGSHKGRSIPIMIDMKVANGSKDFVISSSGNAALAAARYIQKRNEEGSDLSLSILVGGRINKDKLLALKNEIHDARITIDEAPRPLQALARIIKSDGKTGLRQSTDDEALIGYKSLADEIVVTPDLEAVFIATSSGTTAQALANSFIEHSERTGARLPEIHIVQTTGISPIAQAFTAEESEPGTSLADAIIDKVAHRREALVEAIKKTKGSGWIVKNDDIREAQKLLRENGIEATGNGALGLAGLIKALHSGKTFGGSVVVIITGK